MTRQTTTDESDALRRVIEHAAILDLIARFDDAVIRRDIETFRSLWVEDGLWQFSEPNVLRAEGIEQIVATLQKFNEMNEFFFRTTLRSVIALDGERATARAPSTEYARRHDGHGYNNVALYEDELVRRDGQWKFVSRFYQYIWIDASSPISGSAAALPPGLSGEQ